MSARNSVSTVRSWTNAKTFLRLSMGTNGLFISLIHLILRLVGHTHVERSLLSVLNPLLDIACQFVCLMTELDEMTMNSTHSFTESIESINHSLTINQSIKKHTNKINK